MDLNPSRYVEYDSTGRVIASGTIARNILDLYETQGKLIYRLPSTSLPSDVRSLMDDSQYVDLSGSVPLLRDRPIWTAKPSPAPLLPKQEAVIVNLPPCKIAFSGPVTGAQDHPTAGDAKIGFTMPGTYVLQFEPFPYMPVVMTVEVSATAIANAATTTATTTANVSVKV